VTALGLIAGAVFFVSMNVLCCVLTARAARRRGRNGTRWVAAAVVFGWLAWLALVLTTPRRKRCPDCAEFVQDEARVCRHCSYRFEEAAPQSKPTGLGAAAIVAGVALTSLLVALVSIGVAWTRSDSASSSAARPILSTVSSTVHGRTPSVSRFSIRVPAYKLAHESSFSFQRGFWVPARSRIELVVWVHNSCAVQEFLVRAYTGSPPAAHLRARSSEGFAESYGDHSVSWSNAPRGGPRTPFHVVISVANLRLRQARHVWVEYAGCYPS
jgi:hypothetical protein